MGKYSDALRKLEEKRNERGDDHPKNPLRSLKTYVFGILICSAIVLLVVYAYGVRQGAQFVQKIPSRDLSTNEPIASSEAAISSVREVTARENEILLESVEKMMDLSYGSQSAFERASVPASGIPQQEPTGSAEPGFYTIQLISYQSESAAHKEARRWKEKGFQTVLLQSGKYYAVCIGQFGDRSHAEAQWSELKVDFENLYRDAFVRFVKQRKADSQKNL